ncbi:MAG: chemotaxis-specific protein-glutamate methyltransferase CheB [Pirellulaceae bacterium]
MAPNESQKLRVLIADDMLLFQKIIKEVLDEIPGVEVVGTATDGIETLLKTATLKPDLITLDVEMPKLDGLEVLMEIKSRSLNSEAIIVSGLSDHAAEITAHALQIGAFDFILKPDGAEGLKSNMETLSASLKPRIEAFIASRNVTASMVSSAKKSLPTEKARTAPVDIVAIASSTGGPAALQQILSGLSPQLSVPIVVAQHMTRGFTKPLAESLNRTTGLQVVEAEQNVAIQPGYVYIAPGGMNMQITKKHGRFVCDIQDEPGPFSAKPNANILFRSITQQFGSTGMGVVLTGMGNDGSIGAAELKMKGGLIVAQDQRTCTVYGMPRAVVEAGVANEVLPLGKIAQRINNLARTKSDNRALVASET